MFDKEMHAALIADGEKLAALTGTDHGPYFVSEKSTQTSDTTPVDAFRNMFAILHNLDRWELDGVVTDDRSWDRYNDDLTTFVLKLDDARLDKLYALVQGRQPARYRSVGEVV